MTLVIKTVNLTKRYGSLVALSNLNLEVEEGDCFGFIGPNGAGKSTTMKILATLLQPTWGEARVCDFVVGYQSRQIRPLIGYVPDYFGAYDDMVVQEYLEFFAAAYNIHGPARAKVVDDVLQLTDLAYKHDSPVDSLSRGMKQRLSIARTLLHDPKLLLLDEPAGNLDPRARIELRELLKTLRTLGKTILISSAANTTYWPWLKATYGLADSQVRPYTFNIQPFIADKNVVQQGYLSSEPFAIETEAKFKPNTFLLSDFGWPPYSTTIVCMEKTVKERPKAVAAFVKASMEGWKSYLRGDPAPGNALIKKDNPNMTDDKLAHGIKLLNETGMVFGGDAARMGAGVITDARMKVTYDMMVSMKLLDPKVDMKKAYTTEFIKNLRVLP